jgi:WD40 repeat protein
VKWHTESVASVDMNDKLVVTASADGTVSVDNEGDYSCTALLDWLHKTFVNSVALIGDGHILSASYDHAVCTSQLSSSTAVERKDVSFPVNCDGTSPLPAPRAATERTLRSDYRGEKELSGATIAKGMRISSVRLAATTKFC